MVFLQETVRVAMILLFECAVLAKMKHSDVPVKSRFIFVVPGLAVCWITHVCVCVYVFTSIFIFSILCCKIVVLMFFRC